MNRRALVTGTAQGIGRAIADRLATDGYDVVRLDRVAAEATLRCDVADHAAVARARSEIGPVDVLVNNAGIWRYAPLESVEPDEFRAVVDINLHGAFNTMQVFGRDMLRQGSGSIVNIVSISALNASPRVGSYGPSKAALLALTRQAAVDWGPRGVRCNAVGPGMVLTPSTEAAYADTAVRDTRSTAVPLGRLAEPGDIAGVVAFLCSEDARYVTGQAVFADGGFSQSLMQTLAV